MVANREIQRVVLVVVDGVRADLVGRGGMPSLQRLGEFGAMTLRGRTVLPSVTSAAMTSLFTGVCPLRHGIGRQGFGIPRSVGSLEPITRRIAHAGLPTALFVQAIPLHFRWLVTRLRNLTGIDHFHSGGDGARQIVEAAVPTIHQQRAGLVMLHLPDADAAGHEHGWMSQQYLAAATEVDNALQTLVEAIDASGSSRTLTIVLADHGGGGEDPRDHDSVHPADLTIPVVLCGAGVCRPKLEDVHLLDIPATVLWALGLPLPAGYEGRPLTEAFVRDSAAA